MKPSQDLSVSDVANELRIRREHVVELLKSGAIAGYDVTAPGARRKSYRITRQALDDFKAGRSVKQIDAPKRRARFVQKPEHFVEYF